jgi:hypothetical protein
MGEMRNKKTVVGKSEGKRPLRIPKRRWENNIKIFVKEIGCGLGGGGLLSK